MFIGAGSSEFKIMGVSKQNSKIVILLLFVAIVVISGIFVYRQMNNASGSGFFSKRINREDYLSLQAENTLLKKMLGQIEGDVVTLGPANNESMAIARLVWDKTTQGGYLYAHHLPESATGYSLWVQNDIGESTYCGIFNLNTNGEIQSNYRSANRVLKPKVFILAKGATAADVIARGNLP
jgi:hypothetical protein